MNSIHRFRSLFTAVLLIFPIAGFTQEIGNIRAEQRGDRIHIYYDLTGMAVDQPTIVRVFLSTDGGKTYGEPLKSVTGDVGVVIGPGMNRHIIWDVLDEVDELVSEQAKFKIKADPLQSDQQRIKPEYVLNLNANLGSKVSLNSYGFDLKFAVYLRQLGLGVRGVFYRTYGEHPDYADFEHYWGFGGGAVIEYDFVKNPKYAVYPFLYVGQTKIHYVRTSLSDEHSGYSIFYTPGLGFNINVYKFIYLGVELEYYLAPRIDIVDRGSGDVADNIVMDGFSIGIVLKFALLPD